MGKLVSSIAVPAQRTGKLENESSWERKRFLLLRTVKKIFSRRDISIRLTSPVDSFPFFFHHHYSAILGYSINA